MSACPLIDLREHGGLCTALVTRAVVSYGTRSSLFFRRALPSWGRLVSGGGSRRYSPRFLPFYALPCTLVNTFCFSTFALAWVVGLRRRQQALRILCKSAIIFVHPLGPLMMLLFIVLFQKQTPP